MRADKTTKIAVIGHESTKVSNLIGTVLDDHSRVTTDVTATDAFVLFICTSENEPVCDCSKSIVWRDHWSDNVNAILTVLKSYNLDGSHQQAGRRGCGPV